MNKETIYMDAVTKLNEQDVVIQELAELLSDVLYVWRGYSKSEEYDLYVKANDYLKGLRDDRT
jgi:hypothetical protein